MVDRVVTVNNATGLHARPAAQLVALCKTFKSKITISGGEACCDGKNIFSLLRGCFKKGSVITVSVDGEDENEALTQVVRLIEELEE